MIKKINEKYLLDVIDFLNSVKDTHEDMYITLDKERKFLNTNNWLLIKKVLKYQEVYINIDKEINAILLIYREKGFRPYCKILSKDNKYSRDLLKFLKWNFLDKELYFKLKRDNPISNFIKYIGFISIGSRGKEILFKKEAIKEINKLIPKDNFIGDKKDDNNY